MNTVAPIVLGPYPWATPDVRSAVEHLAPDQAAEFVRLVRAQYRADQRERAHTIADCDLPTTAGVAAFRDACVARAHAGAGGGHRRGPVQHADELT